MTVGRGSVAVAAGIAVSRVSGLVREALVRGRLDVGPAGDAYTAALRVPNLIQNLLGEGVLSASFIPVYSGLVDDDEREAARLANTMFAFLLIVTTPIVVLGVLAAGPITRGLAFGLDDDRLDLTTDLVRIMTPGIGVLVLSAWSLGVLNSHRNFFVPYAAPVVWNVTQIAVVLAGGTGLIGRDLAVRVAWAVTAGAVLQLLFQLPALRRANAHLGRAGISFRSPHFGDTLRRLGPVILGRGSAQVSAFIDLGLATLLATGALAALGVAQVLHLLPISLFAMSIAAAELPEMSRERHDRAAITRRLADAVETVSFFMAFTTIAYLIAGRRIIGSIFSLVPGSRLGDDELLLVGVVVGAYSLGLLALGASRVMQNTFYALGDATTPARIAIIRYVVSASFSVFFMFQFDRLFVYDSTITGVNQLLAPLRPLAESIRSNDDLPLRLGAVGLALGATVGAWVEVVLLRQHLVRQLGHNTVTRRRWRRLVLPTLVAALAMLVVAPLVAGLPHIVAAALLVIPSGVVYVVLASQQQIVVARRLLRRRSAATADSR